MTKQEHIDYWVRTAADDWDTVQVLYAAHKNLHALFWAHLTLEKLLKAHWIKFNEGSVPPKIHNLIWLINNTGVVLDEETLMFLDKFNDFQLSSRYPDYIFNISKICSDAFTTDTLKQTDIIRQCLLKMLQ